MITHYNNFTPYFLCQFYLYIKITYIFKQNLLLATFVYFVCIFNLFNYIAQITDKKNKTTNGSKDRT